MGLTAWLRKEYTLSAHLKNPLRHRVTLLSRDRFRPGTSLGPRSFEFRWSEEDRPSAGFGVCTIAQYLLIISKLFRYRTAIPVAHAKPHGIIRYTPLEQVPSTLSSHLLGHVGAQNLRPSCSPSSSHPSTQRPSVAPRKGLQQVSQEDRRSRWPLAYIVSYHIRKYTEATKTF